MNNWGIIGLGHMGLKMLGYLKKSSQLSSLYIREMKKISLLKKFHPDVTPKTTNFFFNLDEMLHDKNTQNIYVALPPALQYECALKSLQNGKNVLVEKPMTLSETETKNLFNLAKEKKLVLREAYMYRYLNQTHKILSLLQEKKLGRLTSIHTEFHYQPANQNNSRYYPHLGGGVLNDIGCYFADYLGLILNESPIAISTLRKEFHTGVDEHFFASLSFPSCPVATIDCSFLSPRDDLMIIRGSEGFLHIKNPIKADTTNKIIGEIDGEPFQLDCEDLKNSYEKEIESFEFDVQNAVIENQYTKLSIHTATLVERLRREVSR